MNELVVGVDGSEESRLALQWAASVTTAIGVRLVAVEAWEGGDPATAGETADRVRRNLADAVTAILGQAGDAGVDLDISFEALAGSAAGAILERVTADDGLILGSRGRGGFAGLLLGSVSRECVEHAPCPVMVVRHDRMAPHSGTNILVGHDGSPTSARALEWAVSLGGRTGAEVVAAHVWQTTSSEVRPRLLRRISSKASRSIEKWAGEVSSDVRPLELEGEPRMELVNLARRLDASLLVIGRRGNGKVRALRMGSVASYLVTSSPVPIAVIPPLPGSDVS
jgi:nucleotide-binding universal stress UspA family protein